MATRIGISQAKFTINEAPTFLLGLTYFDAINARQSDLAVFRARGVNYLRLMLNWPQPSYAAGSLFDSSGVLKTTEKATLMAFIQAADALGIVIELVILHDGVDAFLTTGTDRTAAITNACAYFGNEPNVMFDICNEIDLASATWATTFASWDALLDTAQANTSALCYVSVSPTTVEGDGPFMNHTTDVIDSSFMTSWMNTSTDVCTPHFKGNVQWWWSKGRRVRNLRTWLDANGHSTKPIHINEDNRWGEGYGDTGAGDISADKYLSTMLDSVENGAASWTFHSDGSYDLSPASLFRDLFDEDTEREIFDRMGRTLEEKGILTPFALLDTFNRANEGPPPSAHWVVCTGTGFEVVSNVAKRDAVAQQACTWGGRFYKNQKASFKIATSTPDTNGSGQGICLRMEWPEDYTSEHYEISFNNSAVPLGQVTFYYAPRGGGAFTQLGAIVTLGAALAIGDVCMAEIVDNTITAYVNGSSVGSRSDVLILRGGWTAMRQGQFNAAEFDDYSAGAIYSPKLSLARTAVR